MSTTQKYAKEMSPWHFFLNLSDFETIGIFLAICRMNY
jgi:hypothetical protein